MNVRVVSGDGAAARDAAAIGAGTPSRSLMQRAGAAAAEVMMRRFGDALGGGVLILTGPGNNGGDGWVLAGQLSERGIPVRVHEVVESRTGDAYQPKNNRATAFEATPLYVNNLLYLSTPLGRVIALDLGDALQILGDVCVEHVASEHRANPALRILEARLSSPFGEHGKEVVGHRGPQANHEKLTQI